MTRKIGWASRGGFAAFFLFIAACTPQKSETVAQSCGFATAPTPWDVNTQAAVEAFASAIHMRTGRDWPAQQTFNCNVIFADALHQIESKYVLEVPQGQLVSAAIAALRSVAPDAHAPQLVAAAIKGMLRSLDDRSNYLSLEQIDRSRQNARGLRGGTGFLAQFVDGAYTIYEVLDGSPAARAGLRVGDVVAAINGEAVPQDDAAGRLYGPIGSDLRLTIRRASTQSLDVTLTFAPEDFSAVRSALWNGIAYLRLPLFGDDAQTHIRMVITQLRAESAHPIIGYILDLRGNPGGRLEQATATASDFIGAGEFGSIGSPRSGEHQGYVASGPDPIDGAPLAVLIDHYTAEGAELVAAALQDRHRATVIGERSLGQGSVQTVIPLNVVGFGAMILTTDYLFRISGRAIEGAGVQPDIEVPWPDTYDVRQGKSLIGDPVRDLPLARAIQLLHGSARSGPASP